VAISVNDGNSSCDARQPKYSYISRSGPLEAELEVVEVVVEGEAVVGLVAEVWNAVVIVDREVDATIVTDSAVDVVGGDNIDSEVEKAENDADVMVDYSVTAAEVDRVRNVKTEDVKDEMVISSTVVEPERDIDGDTSEPDVMSIIVDSDVNVSVNSNEVKLDVDNRDVESNEVDTRSDIDAVKNGDDRDVESDVDTVSSSFVEADVGTSSEVDTVDGRDV
jgi:hypothetical protein